MSSSDDHRKSPSNALSPSMEDASRQLSECLFGQYAGTVMAVSGATGYALYRRHPNGLGLMLVAGAAGTLVDLAYGWNVSCHSQVTNWQRHREATAAQASEKNKAKDEK